MFDADAEVVARRSPTVKPFVAVRGLFERHLGMSTSEPPTDADWTREQMRRQDESRFEQRVARALRTKSNNFMMPIHWFHVASSECREIFCDGHFNGCVCLVQAVAEGLTKFLVEHNPGTRGNSQEARITSLHSRHVIGDASRDALLLIVGADRRVAHF